MTDGKRSPRGDWIDPAVRHARREAWVILAAFAVFLVWSVFTSYGTGYPELPQAAPQQLVGMPSWVFWGVVMPWIVADLFAVWFCFFFMADDPLDGDGLGDEPGEELPEEPPHG